MAVAPTWRTLIGGAAPVVSASDAHRIAEEASGLGGSRLWASLDDEAPPRASAVFGAMVERRGTGEPLQYVLGRWGFRYLDLLVDRRVLIPRPETEQVVEVALAQIDRLVNQASAGDLVTVDLGTGSGAIALSIAVERPAIRVWGTDVCSDALDVARANLSGIGSAAAMRVTLAQGRWWSALPAEFRGGVNVAITNPPYVATTDELPAEVAQWEPGLALWSGPAGLDAVAEIVAEAPEWLARPGVLVLELDPRQAAAAVSLARGAGCDEAVVHADLNGRDRMLVARWGCLI